MEGIGSRFRAKSEVDVECGDYGQGEVLWAVSLLSNSRAKLMG